MTRYKSLPHAFFANVPADRSPDRCWEWKGTIVGGYGMVRFRDKRYLAHRLSYKIFYGIVPDDKQVCHECDNPRCVNPDHLWLGTNADNHADKIAKGRQGRVVGPRQPSSKLVAAQVFTIRRLAREGVGQQEIAEQFGTSQGNVSRIVQRKAWAYLP